MSTCLFILAILSSTTRAFSLNKPSYSIAKPHANYHLIANELSRNHTISIAYIDRIEESTNNVIVNVSIIGQNSQTQSECSINLRADGELKSVNVSSLKRLSRQKILVTIDDPVDNPRSEFTLLNVDLHDCKFSPVPLPREHFIVTSQDSDEFDILISDKYLCKSLSAKCRISYDGTNTTVNPFDMDINLKNLRVEYTKSRDFIISGLDTVGVYKFSLLDRSFGSRRDLLAIPNARNMEFVSSQLSTCWIEKPGEDKSVHCTEFDEDGELLLRKTLTYREPITLVSLNSLTSGRNLLLVRKVLCDSDWDCWTLYVTQVQNDMKIWSTQYTEHFDCSGERIVFSARLIDDSVLAEYVCDNGNHFTYKNYVIDTTDQ